MEKKGRSGGEPSQQPDAAKGTSPSRSRPVNATAQEKLVQALLAANARKRGRGAPTKDWRTTLRLPMARVMHQYPDEPISKIAQILFDGLDDGGLTRTQNVGSVDTIRNWLSAIRRGEPGTGRTPKLRP
jgi:hypothetical protein